MIAWLARLLLLVQLGAAIGIYLLLTRSAGLGSASLAALLAFSAVLGVRLLIVFNNFVVAWRHRSPLPEHCRLNWPRRFALFFGEAKASLLTSSWTMAFRRFHKRPADPRQGPPVLLIHGYGCNSGYWHPMSTVLRAARITHYAIDMEPVFGSIDDYSPRIAAAVEELCRDTGSERIVVVAHSMGGLAVRAYLRDFGARRIARIVTLGTPHHGTALAQFGLGTNSREMHWVVNEEERPGSEWLCRLSRREDPALYRLFVSIYSRHDNIVSPQDSSVLPGAQNIALHGIGHVALGFDPQVQALVVRKILEAN